MTKKLNMAENVTPAVSVYKNTTISKTDAEAKLAKFRKEESRLVKGIFQFFECPGMSAKITCGKYKGEIFSKEMMDGQEYEIPLYVARFLNGIDVTAEGINGKLDTCSYPVNSYIMDKDGNPYVHPQKRKRRFGFQSMEFAGGIKDEVA